MLTCALDEATRRNPAWARVVHEELCLAPQEGFAAIASTTGLRWSTEGDRALDGANRQGTGYETARSLEGLGNVWRRRLDEDQVGRVADVLDRLPLLDGYGTVDRSDACLSSAAEVCFDDADPFEAEI